MSLAGRLTALSLSLVACALAVFAALAMQPSSAGATNPPPALIYVDSTVAPDGNPCTVNSVNYDACYSTIQAAINAAAPGATIWVDDGTYNENININKALTLVSLDGAATTIIQASTNDTPVVDVTADEVTFGGPGGAGGGGFTVNQQDPGPAAVPHAGNAALRVLGNVVGPDSVVIQNNTYLGCQTDEGILINPAVEGGHLVIDNNTFGADTSVGCFAGAPDYGFKDLIHFHFTTYGAPLSSDVSLQTADVEITDNTGTAFGRSGVYFHADIFNSSVLIDGNDFTADPTPPSTTYGLYFAGKIRTFSNVLVTDTAVRGADYGAEVDDELTNKASLAFGNFTTEDHQDYGLYFNYPGYNMSGLSIVDSLLDGDGSADYGIYLNDDIDERSTALISNTRIQDIDYAGIYQSSSYYVENGGNLTIRDVTITDDGTTGFSYGVYTQTEYGGSITIDPTIIDGFTDTGIYVGDQYAGTNVVIDANELVADEDGGNYCFYFGYGPNYGSVSQLTNNTCDDFGGNQTGYGIYDSSGTYYESQWTIDNNTFNGDADNPPDYGAYFYYIQDGSTLNFTNNDFTNLDYAGFYMDSNIEGASTVLVDNNTFASFVGSTSAYEGVYFSGDTTDFSTTTISDNDISGFYYYGIYHYDTTYGGQLNVLGNTITAPQDGMEYGIYLDDFDYAGHGVVNDNTVTGFGGPNSTSGYGLYLYEVYEGSTYMMDGNTFTSHADGGDYGMYVSSYIGYEATDATISDNIFNGFDYAGLYLYDANYDGDVTITGNTVTAHADGAEYGLYFDDIDSGDSNVVVNNNNFSGFGGPNAGTGYGVYVYSIDEASNLDMDGNTFAGDEADYFLYLSNEFQNGSRLTLTNNTISGIDYSFVYLSPNIDYGSQLVINDNVMAAEDCTTTSPYTCLVGPPGVEYGIYLEDNEYGSTIDIQRNVINGFGGDNASTGYGVYVDYATYDGGWFKLIDNQMYGVQGSGANGPDYGVYVSSYLTEYGGEAYVNGNTITGFDYAGLYLYYSEYGDAWVNNNTLTADPAGAEYGIYWDYVEYGGTLESNNNVITGFGGPNASTGYGIYHSYTYQAQVSYDNNTLTAHPGGSYYCVYQYYVTEGSTFDFTNNDCTGFTDYGHYISSYIDYGSVATYTGNTYDGINSGAYAGFYASDSVDDGSSLYVNNNTISDVTDYGLYLYYIEYGGDLHANNNNVTGHMPGGLDYGLYNDGVEYGADGEFNGNTFTNIGGATHTGYGMWFYDSWYGSTMDVCDNSVTGLGDADYGYYFDYLSGDGSSVNICNNSATGFDYAGIYVSSGTYSGGDNVISGNVLTASALNGADYGIDLEDTYDGTTTVVSSNTINGIDGTAGIDSNSVYDGGTLEITNNIVNVDQADYGLYLDQVYDGATLIAAQNEISGYDEDGINLATLWGAQVTIQNNVLDGDGTDAGVDLDAIVQFGALVNILNNCITDSDNGVVVTDLTDTAEIHINFNDLSDPPVAIDATGVTKTVDGENNYYGGTGPGGLGSGTGSDVLGNVDYQPFLNSAPSCSGATATPTPSASPSPTPSATATGTSTPTPSPSPTPGGNTPRPTRTPVYTPTTTPSGQPQSTQAPTATVAPTNTPTSTPVVATDTPTPPGPTAPGGTPRATRTPSQ